MIHLHKDMWLDADEWGFNFCYKTVYKNGKYKGKERFDYFSSHSTEEQVSQKIKSLALYELCNGDFTRAIEYFNEVHGNFVKGLPVLQKKRYSYRK